MFEITMIVNAMVIIIIGIALIYSIKKYNNLGKKSFKDSDGVKHTIIFDKKSGQTICYFKSNGEYYEFRNDKEGRLIYYKDHTGVEYISSYNKDGLATYREDCVTGEKFGYTYDEEGRVKYRIDYNTGVGEWYSYNEKGELYRTLTSEHEETIIPSKMPEEEEEATIDPIIDMIEDVDITKEVAISRIINVLSEYEGEVISNIKLKYIKSILAVELVTLEPEDNLEYHEILTNDRKGFNKVLLEILHKTYNIPFKLTSGYGRGYSKLERIEESSEE